MICRTLRCWPRLGRLKGSAFDLVDKVIPPISFEQRLIQVRAVLKEAREGGFSPEISSLLLRTNPGAAPAAGSSIGAPVPDPESTSRVAPTRATDPTRVS